MKINNYILTFTLLFLFTTLSPPQLAANQGNEIHWMTNYEKAKELSIETQRPMVLFFTGTDWCGWCNKLEREVFDTPEFMGMINNKLIFVKLDFPMKSKLDPATTRQNELLQKQFSVRSYPTVIILGPDQQPIGTTGYRSGGGKQYAQHLIKMVNEKTAYKQQTKR